MRRINYLLLACTTTACDDVGIDLSSMLSVYFATFIDLVAIDVGFLPEDSWVKVRGCWS